MTKAVRLVIVLGALAAPAVVVAGCGGVPGNAVAEVDGTVIEKSAYEHWLNVASKSSGQPNAQVPKPPDYVACIQQKRKTTPKPKKGQPETTDAQLKTQCRQEYEQLRNQVLQLLIQGEWIEGEAEEQGVKLSDAEVRKNFNEQKKQSFPKEADYKKFLKDSGQTEDDLVLRIRQEMLANKIQEQIVKGKDKVSDAQVAKFYNENKERFAQPERRDLRIVLTKGKAKAEEAKQALESGESWKTVARRYSIDEASKSQGGKLPGTAEGTVEKSLDKAVFSAEEGELSGPVKTQFGWYVFEVTKVNKASQQTLDEAKDTIKQTVASQNQQKALDTFVKDFNKRWKERTDCREGFVTQQCKQGPDPTPTPTPGAAPPQQGQGAPPVEEGAPPAEQPAQP